MKLLISVVVCLQLCSQQLLADPVPALQPVVPRCKPRPRCEDSDLHITVDNRFELYIDGHHVNGLQHPYNWTYSDTVRVPASARVLAVYAVDLGVVAGILASGAHFTTDSSWRCSNYLYPFWNEWWFDDRFWSHATEIGRHNTPGDHWGTISGISLDAKWIWSPKYIFSELSDNHIYCRKKRTCTHDTGGPCITSCHGRVNGEYQSCKGCGVYATCKDGVLKDDLPCAPEPDGRLLFWDENTKKCQWESETCR
jgi:hypothetical protein